MGAVTKQQRSLPILRFAGFSDSLMSVKVSDICSIKTGNRDTQDRVRTGKYPFFVRSNTIERINSFSYEGEAILTSGDGVGVGKNFHYIDGKFDWHQRVYCLSNFSPGYSIRFIYYLFSQNFYKRVVRLSAKNSVDSVRMEMIADMVLFCPTVEEQQKIADFLGSIDEWLDNLREQKTALENYKRGMMQKLFTQQVRFKEENGNNYPEWEMRPLYDLATSVKGKGLSKDDVVQNGSHKCIRYAELYTVYDEVISNVKSSTNIGVADMVVSKVGDLLFPSSGETAIDIATFSSLEEDGVILSGDLNAIRFKVKSSSPFFAYYLSNCHNQDIAKYAQGNSVVHLYWSHFKKIHIQLPSFLEQEKIADFLVAIDKTITAKVEEISKVEQWKKGLMQKMFV